MRLILTSILLLAPSLPAPAQTNPAPAEAAIETPMDAEPVPGNPPPADPGTSTNAAASIETHIFSDTVELGIKTRSAVYRGNVRLEDPRIHLTCEQLTADVPEGGERVEQVIAETNVVITMVDEKGLTNRAFADKAVYTYRVVGAVTNEIVELTGESDPHVERPEGDLYGNPIVWDRTRNQVRATNQRMIYRGNPAGNTNAASGTSLLGREPEAGAAEPSAASQPGEPSADKPADE